MGNKKENIKLIIVFSIIIVGFILFAFTVITNKVEVLKYKRYLEVSKSASNELKTLIDEKQETILNISLSMAENDTIKNALLQKNSSNLNLSAFALKLKENTVLKSIWFQIANKDGMSFYRSWTQKTGDDLKKIRIDIPRMIENPKITTSISTGKFDLTFKAMVPIYDNGRFIGIFETIAKFNSVAVKMNKKGYDTVIIVDKRYKKQLTKAYSETFIDDYYVANTNAKKELLKVIKSETVEHCIEGDEPFHINQKSNKFVSFYYLPDIYNKPMAYFIIFQDLDNIYIEDILQIRENLIGIFATIFLILVGIFYYLYIKRYRKFIENLNIELEEKVKHKTKTLDHLAHHDSLTNLPNRLLFLDRFQLSIEHAKRRNHSVYLLFLDLDRFKEVNDSFGHEAGDELLKIVSTRLKKCVRSEDTIARLGGDEFTILIEDVNENNIVKITEKIIDIMQAPIHLLGSDIYVTFSIGISKYPEDGTTPEILLRNADTAMYRAKELGKNTYQFYNTKMTEHTYERLMLDTNIRRAIEKQEFQPYYQPQVNALTGDIIGIEALIRWRHPELGTISPDKFIPFAEEVGLIVEIDKWMMLNTMQTLLKFQQDGLEPGKLSLNLSIKHLESSSFINDIKSLFTKTGFDPKNLELEITESQIMKTPESAISILNEIKKLGVTIAIDDFGTGYSSLSYLKRLPIDKLKIDRSFIKDIPYDEEDSSIVRAVIALAKSLKLDIIAEGVENEEQKDFLLEEGCVNIQGYFYSRPIPSDEFRKFLT